MEKPAFIPTMRLNIQASIPITTKAEAEIFYNCLKTQLQEINTDVTLSGQVMMMLEPCCNKAAEKKT